MRQEARAGRINADHAGAAPSPPDLTIRHILKADAVPQVSEAWNT
jgi:hypothetical protein